MSRCFDDKEVSETNKLIIKEKIACDFSLFLYDGGARINMFYGSIERAFSSSPVVPCSVSTEEEGEIILVTGIGGEKIEEWRVKNAEFITCMLAMKDTTCPYPDHPGYVDVWNTLSPAEQKTMAETLRITADQKVEIVPLHKKFSLLSGEHDGESIFSGMHIDEYGKQGVLRVTYFTGNAAMREANKQGKKLFETMEEVQSFMSYFPGEDEEARVRSFVSIMGLQKAGAWSIYHDEWGSIGSEGYAMLSQVSENGDVYRAYWIDDGAGMEWMDQNISIPVIISEDC